MLTRTCKCRKRPSANEVRSQIKSIAEGARAQFGAIILDPPTLGHVKEAKPGPWNYLRVRFRIWPGQNDLIEKAVRQQIVNCMKAFDPNYSDWMVTVTYRAPFETPEKKDSEEELEQVPQPRSERI